MKTIFKRYYNRIRFNDDVRTEEERQISKNYFGNEKIQKMQECNSAHMKSNQKLKQIFRNLTQQNITAKAKKDRLIYEIEIELR